MPKVVDHEAQRSRIASAAIHVIGESGLDNVRLVDVARIAGATTGTITHYFDGKDALLLAALEQVAETLIRDLGELDTSDARVAAEMALPLDEAGMRDWRVLLAYWGRALVNPELAAIHKRYYQQFHTLVAEALADRQASGAIAQDMDLGVAADALIAAIDGLGMRATLEPEAWPAERQVRQLQFVFASLLAPAPCETATTGGRRA